MKEQSIDLPCPICSSSGNVNMIAHIDEIPYFGEHTQVTILCHDCGWRQTDFIPAEGKKAGGWSMVIDEEEKLRARVVRSINMVERDLSNQFLAAEGAERDALMEQMATLQHMTLTLANLGVTLLLLDPHGHSMILHPDAEERPLTEDELATLPVGPDPAVFSTDDTTGSA